jgi:stage II sporulation protein D
LYLISAATICVIVAVIVSLGAVRLSSLRYSGFSGAWAESASEDKLDQRFVTAATAALGDRRGTVIVMDPQTGRVRAVVNSEIAFGENLPPGSTIKPFTALAAMRSGLIDEDSHTLCREKYSHEGFQTICSHPRDLAPLNPTEAIAYSCNYYFGKVGERLDETSFDATLNEFGFGKSSGINAAREGQGKLPRAGWHSQNAIGESDDLQATPIQLIDAYSALVNGGHLFTPRVALASGYVPQLRANISIKDQYRSLIVKGMRGAVRYGTAETANLYSLPVYVFGKTGTATQIDGFRSQGWFVGFASPLDENSKGESESAPQKVKLAVLVFLAKAHGSEAAQVARPIFEEYARSVETGGREDRETEGTNSTMSLPFSESPRLAFPSSVKGSGQAGMPVLPSSRLPVSAAALRVHLVRENLTREMSLEDYILGVVAAEGSTETEPEALKALAIASRTYALKNIGRHSADGYDFCTTTHCQRFRDTASDSEFGVSSAALKAVQLTKGEVLLDAGNQVADSYFSASCGGATANMTTLWGAKAPPYLRGVADEYCATDAQHNWTDVISEKQLLRALQTDPRTNVGNRLVGLRVLRQDASGRAEIISIEGQRRLTVKGWDFKIIVGRALGWNVLKSSRFEIARSGSNFVFRGSGFGHGLGLCQEGAHVMASRGANYRQILGKYFPGTTVETRSGDAVASLPSPGKVFEVISQSKLFASGAPVACCSKERSMSTSGSVAMRSVPPRGSWWAWVIVHCQLPILDWRLAIEPIGNRQSQIENPETHPLPRGGTDFIAFELSLHNSTPMEHYPFADLLWRDEAGALRQNEPFAFVPTTDLIGRSLYIASRTRRLTLASERLNISYPASIDEHEIEALMRLLQSSRAMLTGRVIGAGITVRFPDLKIFINETTGDFVGRTGQPPWAAAATKSNLIELQPLETLRRRRILETTLRHELVHVLVDSIGQGRTPRWLAEGLALHLAGEGRMVARYATARHIATEDIDKQLSNATSANDMRVAYAAAYGEVKRLINKEGEANVWRRVAR